MIRLESISKSFEGKPAMTEITALFHKGRPNLIIGRSGSGKTVLMKCIIGLLTPDSGEIYYGDDALSSLSEARQNILRQEMGVVFQGRICGPRRRL
ncbi:MAG: ATP-binding cassette domain-containing protein, partial [Bacteroidales bacterium]